jgi:hypothetical protein
MNAALTSLNDAQLRAFAIYSGISPSRAGRLERLKKIPDERTKSIHVDQEGIVTLQRG